MTAPQETLELTADVAGQSLGAAPLLGDTVEWTSQSGGHYGKVKRGDVVQIVKAGDKPELVGDVCGTLRTLGDGFGMSRKHESYLVRVGNIGYWPRVKHLRVVSPNDQALPQGGAKKGNDEN